MHSFLFPEDINGPSTQRTQQRSTPNTRKPAQRISGTSPQMLTRAPPTIPQHDIFAPPPPSYAPPPIPAAKEKAAVSVTELAMPVQKQDSRLQRSQSKWSRREIASISGLKERRAAKARAAAAMAEVDVVLPPLSPVVDEEFWRTGRYPTSPLSLGMVHVAF